MSTCSLPIFNLYSIMIKSKFIRTVFILLITSIFFIEKNYGQVSDSLFLSSENDTASVITVKDSIQYSKAVDLKTPRKAMLKSVMLPGLGQAYNRQYWKIPIVYGGFAALIYAIDFNTSQYHRFKKVYQQKIDKLPGEFPNSTPEYIRNRRDNFRKNMELSYIALVGIYGINVLDAFVSAHLKSFDINEDIGLKIKPKMEMIDLGFSRTPSAGIGLCFNLH